MPLALEGHDIEWNRGVSFLLFPDLPDKSVNLALIDTDHNYWTLMRELETIAPKMAKLGVICIHDTESYKDHNGTMEDYGDGRTPYPAKEIKADDERGKFYGMAIPDFLSNHPEWEVARESPINDGAVALVLTYP